MEVTPSPQAGQPNDTRRRLEHYAVGLASRNRDKDRERWQRYASDKHLIEREADVINASRNDFDAALQAYRRKAGL